MSIQSLHIQLMDIAPYRPIWVQFGEVAFSVTCFTAPNSPTWIQFGGVHHDPCSFDYIKFDEDWFKLTLPFGIKFILNDFEPLAAMLFCLST